MSLRIGHDQQQNAATDNGTSSLIFESLLTAASTFENHVDGIE